MQKYQILYCEASIWQINFSAAISIVPTNLNFSDLTPIDWC